MGHLAQADPAEAELAVHRRGRPQRRQRLYARLLNLAGRAWRTLCEVLAMLLILGLFGVGAASSALSASASASGRRVGLGVRLGLSSSGRRLGSVSAASARLRLLLGSSPQARAP